MASASGGQGRANIQGSASVGMGCALQRHFQRALRQQQLRQQLACMQSMQSCRLASSQGRRAAGLAEGGTCCAARATAGNEWVQADAPAAGATAQQKCLHERPRLPGSSSTGNN